MFAFNQEQNSKSKSSFTMIELIIIIGIIGIMVLVGIPAFKSYQPRLELSGAVRDLVSDLRYTQQLAVTEQVEHSVYFIPLEKEYEIRRYGAITSIIKTVSLPAEIKEISITGLSDANGSKEARYNPYGAVRDSGTVAFKNSQDVIVIINIKPSGFVKIGD